MKITEICVGNYVYNKDNELCKVCVVDLITNSVIVDNYAHDDGTFYEYAIDEIKGVPITEEILNKGFRKDDQWEHAYYINDHIHIYSIADSTRYQIQYVEIFDLQYVHELQHALTLLGFDKEIKL